MTSQLRNKMLTRAICNGMPIVRVGRGNNDGFTAGSDLFIGGNNLTSTKARLVLLACLLKFGSLPLPADEDSPTKAELEAIAAKVTQYQEVFAQH